MLKLSYVQLLIFVGICCRQSTDRLDHAFIDKVSIKRQFDGLLACLPVQMDMINLGSPEFFSLPMAWILAMASVIVQ